MQYPNTIYQVSDIIILCGVGYNETVDDNKRAKKQKNKKRADACKRIIELLKPHIPKEVIERPVRNKQRLKRVGELLESENPSQETIDKEFMDALNGEDRDTIQLMINRTENQARPTQKAVSKALEQTYRRSYILMREPYALMRELLSGSIIPDQETIISIYNQAVDTKEEAEKSKDKETQADYQKVIDLLQRYAPKNKPLKQKSKK